MPTLLCQTRPRVGLLGDPSDLYSGRVLGFTFADFATEAQLEVRPRDTSAPWLVLQGADSTLEVRTVEELDPAAGGGGSQLLAAGCRRLLAMWPDLGTRTQETCLHLSFSSDVPRQAGLSGSSAIILSALQVLCRHFELEPTADELALMALEAETLELDSIAGPQDRVLQAHGGLLAMDFTQPGWSLQRLDPQCLPPLLIAWHKEPGAPSGDVHAGVRQRFLAGEPKVREVMERLAGLVQPGVQALLAGDCATLADLMDQNFELRRSLFQIDTRDQELIQLGREAGAGAKLCGSGGAAVFVPRSAADLPKLQQSLDQGGWHQLQPEICGPASD